MIFKSAVDTWFTVMIVAAAVITAAAILPVFGLLSGPLLFVVVASVLLSIVLPVWLLISTYYRVDPETLYVRSGPFSWTIPRNQITGIRESRSWLSSPALSLRRLEIRYGDNKSVLVSPADQRGFLEAIGHAL